MMIKYNPKGKEGSSIFNEDNIKSFKRNHPNVCEFILSFLEENKSILNKGDFYLLFKKWEESDVLYSCMAIAHALYLSGIDFAKNMTWNQILELFPNYLERFEDGD